MAQIVVRMFESLKETENSKSEDAGLLPSQE